MKLKTRVLFLPVKITYGVSVNHRPNLSDDFVRYKSASASEVFRWSCGRRALHF